MWKEAVTDSTEILSVRFHGKIKQNHESFEVNFTGARAWI
jgi:hypothetical protein